MRFEGVFDMSQQQDVVKIKSTSRKLDGSLYKVA